MANQNTNRFLLFVVFTVFFWLSAALVASAIPSREPISDKWALVAKSDMIAKARLKLPLNEGGKCTGKLGWINLEVSIEETAKGSFPEKTVPVRYYTEPPEGSPSLSSLEKYTDQEVILFLIQVEGSGEPGKYYCFADRASDVVSPFSPEAFSNIVSEVKNQQEIVKHFNELPVGITTGADLQVRKLFDNLTTRQTQEKAWVQLLRLSRKDIPAIVRNISDFRAIPDFDAYLPNPPGADEAVAHYGPQRIVEAALLILQYITRLGFRRYASCSEREWLAEIDGWRCWCEYNF